MWFLWVNCMSSVTDWICVFPSSTDSYVEALTPSVDVFGDGASEDAIKVKWGHRGVALIQQDLCPYEKRYQSVHSLSFPHPMCACMYCCFSFVQLFVTLWTITHQATMHQRKARNCDLGVQALDLWKNECYLSHPVCSILLWLQELTNNLSKDR